MDITDAAIADFAQHLVPEAFARHSSASRVDIMADPSVSGASGWLDDCQREAAAAPGPSGGSGGMVFVQRRDERWRWDLPNAIWPMETLTERVQREVADVPNPWVFVSSVWDRDRHWVRPGGNVDLETLSWTMLWYFEVRTPHRAVALKGATDVRGSTLGATHPLPARTSFERAARLVLLRHPTRRRYRLR